MSNNNYEYNIAIWKFAKQSDYIANTQSTSNPNEISQANATSSGNIENSSMSHNSSGSSSLIKTASVVGFQISNSISNYVSSRLGEWAGDDLISINFNNASTLINYGSLIAFNPVLGTISVAAQGTSFFLEQYRKEQKESISLNQQRSRNGYTDTKSILTSRGR